MRSDSRLLIWFKMTSKELYLEIVKKGSCLCVGLDTDPHLIPEEMHREDDPVFAFNRAIIDATHKLAVAYKPNLAFYESQGVKGWRSLEKTVDYIRSTDPSLFIIADAKRGDIGNTARQYALTYFVSFDFDAITLAPYMGRDAVDTFLSFPGKWVVLLGLTSNPGARDFQLQLMDSGRFLYEEVIEISKSWGSVDNLMYVVGATKSSHLQKIRQIIPDNFLLVPGVGAQGGSLADVMKYGKTAGGGLLINSSRGIIYASSGSDFAEKAADAASAVRDEMAMYL